MSEAPRNWGVDAARPEMRRTPRSDARGVAVSTSRRLIVDPLRQRGFLPQSDPAASPVGLRKLAPVDHPFDGPPAQPDPRRQLVESPVAVQVRGRLPPLLGPRHHRRGSPSLSRLARAQRPPSSEVATLY